MSPFRNIRKKEVFPLAPRKIGNDHGKKLIWLILALTLTVAAILILPGLTEKEEKIVPQQVDPGFGSLVKKEYNGKTYVARTGLTPILLIGVDRGDNAKEQWGYQQGGQADFLLLIVIDAPDKKVSMLQIDRDTITDVETLGVLGNVIGTRKLQIALSHSYGKTPQDNCAYTVKTVSNLLQGEPLHLYFSVNMSSIAAINDLLGGVTVTMQEDHTSINPAFTKGATVHLNGQDAYNYVHYRMSADDGTNKSRMARQRNYMLAAKDVLLSRLTKDNSFVETLFTALGDDLVTNLSQGRMINEAAKASQYQVGEITQMAGEHTVGTNNYVEFHADEQFLIDWVLSVFYREYK